MIPNTEYRVEFTNYQTLNIEGFDAVLNFSTHATQRAKSRGVYASAVAYMVEKGFNHILELKQNTEFILIDEDMHVSAICEVESDGEDIIINIISVIDSYRPINKYTKTFYV